MGLLSYYRKYFSNEEADRMTEIIPGLLYLGNWKCAYRLTYSSPVVQNTAAAPSTTAAATTTVEQEQHSTENEKEEKGDAQAFVPNHENTQNCEEKNVVHIRHVINMAPQIPNFHTWSLFKKRNHSESPDHDTSVVTYMPGTAIPDTEDANISEHFDRTFDFIDSAISRGEPVLVHCVVGASRSSSIIIAYLMRKNAWNVHTAMEYCKSRRSVVKPNPSFLRQLHLYAIRLGTEEEQREYNSSSSDKTEDSIDENENVFGEGAQEGEGVEEGDNK